MSARSWTLSLSFCCWERPLDEGVCVSCVSAWESQPLMLPTSASTSLPTHTTCLRCLSRCCSGKLPLALLYFYYPTTLTSASYSRNTCFIQYTTQIQCFHWNQHRHLHSPVKYNFSSNSQLSILFFLLVFAIQLNEWKCLTATCDNIKRGGRAYWRDG